MSLPRPSGWTSAKPTSPASPSPFNSSPRFPRLGLIKGRSSHPLARSFKIPASGLGVDRDDDDDDDDDEEREGRADSAGRNGTPETPATPLKSRWTASEDQDPATPPGINRKLQAASSDASNVHVTPTAAQTHVAMLCAGILNESGFESAQAGALSALTSEVERYLLDVFETAVALANHCARRKPNAYDALEVIINSREAEVLESSHFDSGPKLQVATGSNVPLDDLSDEAKLKDVVKRPRRLYIGQIAREELLKTRKMLRRTERRKARGQSAAVQSTLTTYRREKTPPRPKMIHLSSDESGDESNGGTTRIKVDQTSASRRKRKVPEYAEDVSWIPRLPVRHTWKSTEVIKTGFSGSRDPVHRSITDSALDYIISSTSTSGSMIADEDVPPELSVMGGSRKNVSAGSGLRGPAARRGGIDSKAKRQAYLSALGPDARSIVLGLSNASSTSSTMTLLEGQMGAAFPLPHSGGRSGGLDGRRNRKWHVPGLERPKPPPQHRLAGGPKPSATQGERNRQADTNTKAQDGDSNSNSEAVAPIVSSGGRTTRRSTFTAGAPPSAGMLALPAASPSNAGNASDPPAESISASSSAPTPGPAPTARPMIRLKVRPKAQ